MKIPLDGLIFLYFLAKLIFASKPTDLIKYGFLAIIFLILFLN